jgi:hypothetical protein
MLVKVALLLIHGIEIRTDKYAKKLENKIKQFHQQQIEKCMLYVMETQSNWYKNIK